MSVVGEYLKREAVEQQQKLERAKESLQRLILLEANDERYDLDEAQAVTQTLGVKLNVILEGAAKIRLRRELKAKADMEAEIVSKIRAVVLKEKATADALKVAEKQFEQDSSALINEQNELAQQRALCISSRNELRRTAPKELHDKISELENRLNGMDEEYARQNESNVNLKAEVELAKAEISEAKYCDKAVIDELVKKAEKLVSMLRERCEATREFKTRISAIKAEIAEAEREMMIVL